MNHGRHREQLAVAPKILLTADLRQDRLSLIIPSWLLYSLGDSKSYIRLMAVHNIQNQVLPPRQSERPTHPAPNPTIGHLLGLRHHCLANLVQVSRKRRETAKRKRGTPVKALMIQRAPTLLWKDLSMTQHLDRQRLLKECLKAP